MVKARISFKKIKKQTIEKKKAGDSRGAVIAHRKSKMYEKELVVNS